jgi:hypothetical protein
MAPGLPRPAFSTPEQQRTTEAVVAKLRELAAAASERLMPDPYGGTTVDLVAEWLGDEADVIEEA